MARRRTAAVHGKLDLMSTWSSPSIRRRWNNCWPRPNCSRKNRQRRSRLEELEQIAPSTSNRDDALCALAFPRVSKLSYTSVSYADLGGDALHNQRVFDIQVML